MSTFQISTPSLPLAPLHSLALPTARHWMFPNHLGYSEAWRNFSWKNPWHRINHMTAIGIWCILEELILWTNARLSSFNNNINLVTEGMSHPISLNHTASFQYISKPARRTSVVRAGALAGFQLPSLVQLLAEPWGTKTGWEKHGKPGPIFFGCLNLVLGR